MSRHFPSSICFPQCVRQRKETDNRTMWLGSRIKFSTRSANEKIRVIVRRYQRQQYLRLGSLYTLLSRSLDRVYVQSESTSHVEVARPAECVEKLRESGKGRRQHCNYNLFSDRGFTPTVCRHAKSMVSRRKLRRAASRVVKVDLTWYLALVNKITPDLVPSMLETLSKLRKTFINFIPLWRKLTVKYQIFYFNNPDRDKCKSSSSSLQNIMYVYGAK